MREPIPVCYHSLLRWQATHHHPLPKLLPPSSTTTTTRDIPPKISEARRKIKEGGHASEIFDLGDYIAWYNTWEENPRAKSILEQAGRAQLLKRTGEVTLAVPSDTEKVGKLALHDFSYALAELRDRLAELFGEGSMDLLTDEAHKAQDESRWKRDGQRDDHGLLVRNRFRPENQRRININSATRLVKCCSVRR